MKGSCIQVTQENGVQEHVHLREDPHMPGNYNTKKVHMRPQVLGQPNLFCVSAFLEPSVENNSVL